ncbi:hypothetical protein SBA4_1280044 [Candidatus Sulfopaludibacter sp. SbA4]|nr:hypothetical protein SBA4_1280044 [Candidatus Sulfopaludibacter sp. SbA4]
MSAAAADPNETAGARSTRQGPPHRPPKACGGRLAASAGRSPVAAARAALARPAREFPDDPDDPDAVLAAPGAFRVAPTVLDEALGVPWCNLRGSYFTTAGRLRLGWPFWLIASGRFPAHNEDGCRFPGVGSRQELR